MAALCVGGGLIGVATPAAAHLYTGSITVCSPPSTYFNTNMCAHSSLQPGVQTGFLYLQTGDYISVQGSGLRAGMPYGICVSPLSCDVFPGGGGISLLGWDGPGRPRTVMGPDFLVGTGTGDYPRLRVPNTGYDGHAEIYFQEEPQRIEGNGVKVIIDSDGGPYPDPPPGPPPRNVRAVAQPTVATVARQPG